MWSSLLLFYRNVKRTHTDQSTPHLLYSLRKETTHKPSNVAAAKSFSSKVYVIGMNCFDECFSFHVSQSNF